MFAGQSYDTLLSKRRLAGLSLSELLQNRPFSCITLGIVVQYSSFFLTQGCFCRLH